MPWDRYRRLLSLFIAMVFVLSIGILYFFITRGTFVEAFWDTISIISTLGTIDNNSLTPRDKIFSSLLVISSVVLFSFLIASVSEIILSGQLQKFFGERKMKEKLEKMENHYIVCGYGRIGKAITTSLINENLPFVVIEKNRDLIEECINHKVGIFLEGDTTQDEILKEAGIDRAIGLFSALGEDPENLLTVLNARALNPKLKIVTRVSSQELEVRFLRAGADFCISPQSWGSRSMVLTMLHPNVSQMFQQFMDKTIEAGTFIEVVIPEKSPVSSKSLEESGIRKVSQVNVIGIRKAKDHSMIVNPQADFVVESGDTLICLGDQQSFIRLKKHIGC